MTCECWLAQFSDVPCDGPLVRVHLIPRSLLKKEFRNGVYLQRCRPGGSGLAVGEETTWRSWQELAIDRAAWVFACGGIMGNSGHHGMLDVARTLRIPRSAIPEETERFAAMLELEWWLDREYGSRDEERSV